jgi:DNA-binding NtrC family response regulator
MEKLSQAGIWILIVDDEEDTLDACTQALTKEDYSIDTANRAIEALEKVEAKNYRVVIADIKMPGMDGIELLQRIKKSNPQIEVIMITGYATIETAVKSMKEGAYDYLPKPFTPEELRILVKKALEKQSLIIENKDLKDKLRLQKEDRILLGESQKMKEVEILINKVAKTNSTVMILGETGTGKELVAQEIHARSSRSGYPMITVNCAAIPSELLESELFGHEKGAFTGAVRERKGSFELAHGGTIFLDEIGDMSLDLQIKLLRVLQEKEIKPVGSERNILVDVRIIAATNKDLKEAIKRGEFREELYYRLNVVPIFLPPLRERKEDIPLLANYFLKKYNQEVKKTIQGISDEAMILLLNYSWPGNVRELENIVERAVILEEGNMIGPQSFNQLLESRRENGVSAKRVSRDTKQLDSLPPLERVERDYILEVLQATKWNRKKASEILGISTSTIWRKLEKKD